MYEFIMLANFLLWAAMVFVFVRKPAASVFHPFAFYLTFHFLLFVIRPPLVYYRGYNLIYKAYLFTPSLSEKTDALLVTMIGLVAFGIANLYVARTPIAFTRTPGDEALRNRLIVPFALMALVLAPVAIYSMLTSWAADISGMGQMVMDHQTGISINTQSNGYFYESRLMLGPIAVIFAWLMRFRWYSFLPLAAFVILGGGTGTRGPFILAAVALGLIWLYERRRKWPDVRMVLAFIVLAGVFTAVGNDRGHAIRGLFVESQVDAWNSGDDPRFLEGMDTGNLEYVEYLTHTIPARTGTYGYFLDNLQVFTEPVPRVLWPGKPVGEPIKLFNLMDYGYPIGMTRSLPGEGWYSLGFAGVALWCALFGALWGWVYEAFARNRAQGLRLISYLVILPLSILFFRDGVLVTMLRFLLFLAFPLVTLYLIARLFGIVPAHTAGPKRDDPHHGPVGPDDRTASQLPGRAARARGDLAPKPAKAESQSAAQAKLPRAYRFRSSAGTRVK